MRNMPVHAEARVFATDAAGGRGLQASEGPVGYTKREFGGGTGA